MNIPRLRQDWESASRELGKLKDRHLEQAVKYSRALEEQGKASTRERDLLRQVGLSGTTISYVCHHFTLHLRVGGALEHIGGVYTLDKLLVYLRDSIQIIEDNCI